MTVLFNPATAEDVRPIIANIVNSAKPIGRQSAISAQKKAVSQAFGFTPVGNNVQEIIDDSISKYVSQGLVTDKKTIQYEIPDKSELKPIEIRAIGAIRAIDLKNVDVGELDLMTKKNPIENPPGHTSIMEFAKTSAFAVGSFSLNSALAMLAEKGVREYAKDWYNKTTDAEKKTQWVGVLASATSTLATTYLANKYIDEGFKVDAVLVGGVVATGLRALTLLAPNVLMYLNLSRVQEPTKPLAGLTREQIINARQNTKQTRLEQALLRNPPQIKHTGTGVRGLTDKTPIRSVPASLPFVM